MQRRFSGSSLKEMFSDNASNDGTADYDELFKNDALAESSEEGRGMPREETRGPQVRYDPTLTAVQAYAEREYGYDAQMRNGSVSAFDPDMMSRVEVAVDRDEMLDVVHAAHNRRRCVFCTALVVIVGSVVIGSSVGFAKKNGGGGGGTVSSVLVAPPQALERMCSIRNIAREAGHQECETACQAAACCMAAGTKSCFLEQEGICGMYSPCGVLHSQTEGGEYSSYSSAGDDDIVVPPPPADLESQCSDASLSTINGYIACQSACHPGKCCYAGAAHEEDGGSGSNIPFQHSSSSGSYAVESCVQSHRHVCLSYAPCLALGGTGHENPQQTVERKCSADKVKTREGRDACDDLCKARSCCFASSEKRNCRIDNKKWCAEYQACEILLDKPTVEPHKGEFGDVDAIDSNALAKLADQCQQSRIVTHNDLLRCEDACRLALCCFYDDVECDENFEMSVCNDYLFCKPVVSKMFDFGSVDLNNADLGLPQGEGGVTAGEEETPAVVNNNFEPSDALGSAVAEACDPDNLADASGRDDCRVLCEPYLCCADPGPNGCSSNRECPRYEKCENLIEAEAGAGGIVPPNPDDMSSNARPVTEGGGGSGGNDAGGGGKVFDPETNNLALACSEDYLENVPGRCDLLCRGMMCCFDYSESGCYLNPDCSRYGDCAILAEDAGDGGIDSAAVTTLSVNSACDPSTIEDPKKEQACYAMCASHRCCFDGTCPQMGTICDEYEACEIIFNNLDGGGGNGGDYDDSEGMPEPPADLKKVCNPWKIDEGDNRESCLDDCRMGNCCRGVGGDCRHMEYFCDEFILCETVWDDDGSEAFKEDKAAGIGGGGGAASAAQKQPPKTQAAAEPEEPTASVASAPSETSGTNANASADPAVLCSIENLEKPGGEKACGDACRPWKCCWGDNSKGEKNCFDENTNTCLRYLDCPTN